MVALASPLILDNIGWNPFGGWKILVGFIILVCVGRFAWVTAERDPSDPRLALKLWHRPDQRALSAMTCLVLVALPFVLGTDFDPPMDFPWNSWFRIVNYIILFALGAVVGLEGWLVWTNQSELASQFFQRAVAGLLLLLAG